METHLELAHLRVGLGRPEEEITPHLERGLRIADEMAATGGVSSIQALCAALGNAYARRGDPERAVAFYRRAFDFGPPSFPQLLLERMAPLYERLGRTAEFEAFRASLVPPITVEGAYNQQGVC
jgi:tetratricopeptide (TPR) repeat protein